MANGFYNFGQAYATALQGKARRESAENTAEAQRRSVAANLKTQLNQQERLQDERLAHNTGLNEIREAGAAARLTKQIKAQQTQLATQIAKQKDAAALVATATKRYRQSQSRGTAVDDQLAYGKEGYGGNIGLDNFGYSQFNPGDKAGYEPNKLDPSAMEIITEANALIGRSKDGPVAFGGSTMETQLYDMNRKDADRGLVGKAEGIGKYTGFVLPYSLWGEATVNKFMGATISQQQAKTHIDKIITGKLGKSVSNLIEGDYNKKGFKPTAAQTATIGKMPQVLESIQNAIMARSTKYSDADIALYQQQLQNYGDALEVAGFTSQALAGGKRK